MAQIYNTEVIISKAKEMKSESAELSKLIQSMSNIVSEMSAVWDSPAQKEFSAKFGEIEPQLTSFCKNIDSFAERADKHARGVIEIEA